MEGILELPKINKIMSLPLSFFIHTHTYEHTYIHFHYMLKYIHKCVFLYLAQVPMYPFMQFHICMCVYTYVCIGTLQTICVYARLKAYIFY